MWSVLLAIFLVLLILWLVLYDEQRCKQIGEWRHKTLAIAGLAPAGTGASMPTSAPAVSVPSAPAVIAPAAPVPSAPAAPVAVSGEPKKEGFCPKLMQKYGFCDAGAR